MKAIERGADLVGGMPFAEMIDADSRRHTDLVFQIARRFDRDIQMHVDETDDPEATTPHDYAVKALREGWAGRVTADHLIALAAYNDTYAARVIGLVARARMSVVTLPSKLMRGGIRDREPRRRGITRVKELLAAGVNVAYGQDVIQDGFIPRRLAPLPPIRCPQSPFLFGLSREHGMSPTERDRVLARDRCHGSRLGHLAPALTRQFRGGGRHAGDVDSRR